MAVEAFRSNRNIVCVEVCERRHKVLQVFFGRDGSLFVNFPYFRHRTGVLAAATIPGNGQQTNQVDLAVAGRVASHLVKYAHHPDGRAHFSQHGKVRTEIMRQSLRLNDQRGHIFSALIQGLAAFDEANPAKDIGVSPKRATLNFTFQDVPEAIKFVGRWFDISELRSQCQAISNKIGPILATLQPDGRQQMGFLTASGHDNAKHVLLLTCESIPSLGTQPELLNFYGGFDPREIMDNTMKEAGFLAFVYPATNAESLKETIGTIDFEEAKRRVAHP